MERNTPQKRIILDYRTKFIENVKIGKNNSLKVDFLLKLC